MTTDDARAWFNVGLTHEKEGRAVEARQAFEESFKATTETSRQGVGGERRAGGWSCAGG